MEMKHHINTGCNNNINNDKVITHNYKYLLQT